MRIGALKWVYLIDLKKIKRIKKLLAEIAQKRVNANLSRKETNDIYVLQNIENFIIGLDSKKEKLLEYQ